MFSVWLVTVTAAAVASRICAYELRAKLADAHASQGAAGSGYTYQTGSNYFDNPYNKQASGYPSGSFGQSGSAFGIESNKEHRGTGVNSGYYKIGTGHVSGSGPAYNAAGVGSYYNAASSSSGSGLGIGSNNYYGSSGSSSGANNYYGSSGPSSGSNNYYASSGNYNTFGSSSGQALTEYQTTFESTFDTTGLDKIGSYYQSANQVQQSGAKQEFYLQKSQQPTQVFKHFYLISAPEEPENVRRQPITLPPPQKHYKVIFIKAPTLAAPAPQVIPIPQQTEEKTIVYVLVKKPEDIKNIDLPKFEAKLPTKPEVFFIKYDDKANSQALIDNIVKDYNKGGVKASFSGISSGSSGAVQDEHSGSLDGILSSAQSASQVAGVADRFGDGFTLLNNKGSSILETGTGTHLQSSSNTGSGSTYINSAEPTDTFHQSSAVSSSTSGAAGGANTVIGDSNVNIAFANSSFNDAYSPPNGGNSYENGAVGGTNAPALSTVGFSGASPVSAVGSTFDSSVVSTSQGVPHETYGPPHFKTL